MAGSSRQSSKNIELVAMPTGTAYSECCRSVAGPFSEAPTLKTMMVVGEEARMPPRVPPSRSTASVHSDATSAAEKHESSAVLADATISAR